MRSIANGKVSTWTRELNLPLPARQQMKALWCSCGLEAATVSEPGVPARFGFSIAAMLAAAMQTCSAALNTSTYNASRTQMPFPGDAYPFDRFEADVDVATYASLGVP